MNSALAQLKGDSISRVGRKAMNREPLLRTFKSGASSEMKEDLEIKQEATELVESLVEKDEYSAMLPEITTELMNYMPMFVRSLDWELISPLLVMAYICREVDENLRTFWDEFRSLLMKMYELFTPKNRAKILKWLPQLLDEDEFKTFVCEKVHGMYFCTYDEHVVITRHFMNIVNEDRLITSLKRNLDETGEIDMFWSELRDRYGEEESDVGMWIRRIDEILDEEET